MPVRIGLKVKNNRALLSNDSWRRLRHWYKQYGRQFPWRNHTSPWTVLLAETLLHRTPATVVDALYPRAFKAFSSPKAVTRKKGNWISMAAGAGLSWRAHTFVRTCELLVRKHGGRVPSQVEILKSLPGIGHYTAAAVRCFGFGHPECLIDTNTIRVASRVAGKMLNPSNHRTKSVQFLVERLGNDGKPPNAADNYALLDLAGLVCRPKNPSCEECPLLSDCYTGRIRTQKRPI